MTSLEQLLVGTPLDDPAVVDDDDLVGVADGREPVGDRDRRAATHQRRQRTLDLLDAPPAPDAEKPTSTVKTSWLGRRTGEWHRPEPSPTKRMPSDEELAPPGFTVYRPSSADRTKRLEDD